MAIAPRHIIIGRAAIQHDVALLTNEPAIVRISESGKVTKTAIAGAPGRLWGLGSIGADLYSVSGFVDLVRIAPTGDTTPVARFSRPIGNLFDTLSGLAVQHVVDAAGAPLAWKASAAAELTMLAGAERKSLALTGPEEGLLHFLTCSVPPDVACWLPGSNEVLSVSDTAITPVSKLAGIVPVAARDLLSRPSRRAIQDAVRVADGAVVALVPGERHTALHEFNHAGTPLKTIPTSSPLRALLRARVGGIQALSRDGRVVEVRR